ncbi:MAG: hypothetical protein WAX38_05240 [Minisyncoccia bacterium]
MKQFFEEVVQTVRGGHVLTGARLGGLMVLLILIIGAIDQTAGMPRNVYRQTAQAATGGACEMRSNVTGAGSLGETPATKQEKAACIPQKCFQTATGDMQCITPAGAGGQVSGLMDSIGKMLGELMKGGGGGGEGGGDTGGVPPDTTVAPKCSSITASSGKKAINPGDAVDLSWVITGGTPETTTFAPSLPGASVYVSSATITPQKSTTYVLTLKNKAGESKCSVRVYVGPGGYSDVGETTTDDTDTTVTNEDINEDTSLVDPLTGDTKTKATDTNGDGVIDDKDTKYSDATSGGQLGYIASKGVKTNLVADNNAFTEDKNAFKTDANAFAVEELAADEDFDKLAEQLGADGIYSKEDIATLERISREADARKNARIRQTYAGTNQLTPSEVQGLWNRPGEGRTGSLTENIYDDSYGANAEVESVGVLNRFGGWLKRTFCFWCSVERVSFLKNTNQTAQVICVGTGPCSTTAKPTAPKAAPKADKLPAPKTIDADCAAKTKALQDSVCKPKGWSKEQCSGPGKLKPEYEFVPLEVNKLPGDGKLPAPATPPLITAAVVLAQSTTVTKTPPPDKAATCVQRKKIEETAKGCGKCQKGVSTFNTETLTQGVSACGAGASGDPLKYVCREEKPAPKGKDEKTGQPCDKPGEGTCKADPAAQNSNGNGNNNNGNNGGGGQQGGGGDSGKGLADTKMGQGLGEGLGKGLMDMLKGDPKKDDGSQNQNQKPWWWEDTKPTEPPKCVEDTEAEPAQIITKGESTTLSWTVTGKGTIKMVVNYVTQDDKGNQSKGTLGIVDGGSAEVSPDFTTIYKLKATNEIGTVTCKPIKVIVKPVEEDDSTTTTKGEVDLTCDPEEIRANDPATVVWSCPNTSTTSLGTSTEDGTFATDGKTEGSYEVKPLRDATYVVRCRDKFDKEIGRNSCTVKVTGDTGTDTPVTPTVTNRPKVQITAEPPAAPQGSSVTVRWKSQSTASCVVYGPGCDTYGKDSPKCFKEVGRSGFVTGNLYETSTFRAECLAPDRKTRVSDSVTVEVSSSGDEAPVEIEGE